MGAHVAILLRRSLGALITLTIVLCAFLAGHVSNLYHARADWSANNRNTLSAASLGVLEAMPGTIRATVYTRPESTTGRAVSELLSRYTQGRDNFVVAFVNPDVEPERVRALGIEKDGVIEIEYQERRRRIQFPAERTISNALLQVARSGERWVAYLEGHGERDLKGVANHDLGNFGKRLVDRGFNLQSLNLLEAGEVPSNTAVLVIAGPRVNLISQEIALLDQFIARGGNVLWLVDPGELFGLEELAKNLGLARAPGTIIDPTTQGFTNSGSGNPTFTIVSRYGRHRSLDGLDLLTVFPGAGPLSAKPVNDWKPSVLLRTSDAVWAEMDALSGSVSQDSPREAGGPFDIGFSFTRAATDTRKDGRIIAISDGDFLSNAALGNGGNLDLGVRLITWLVTDDSLLDIPVRTDPDLSLALSRTQTAVIGLGWFAGVPILLTLTGIGIWFRRQHR
jgi:ABC-type uncharacterized transport system involved in gliding motility auxiliary subunit